MFIELFFISYVYGKNNFAEVSKNLDTNLKLKHNVAKNFDILATS